MGQRHPLGAGPGKIPAGGPAPPETETTPEPGRNRLPRLLPGFLAAGPVPGPRHGHLHVPLVAGPPRTPNPSDPQVRPWTPQASFLRFLRLRLLHQLQDLASLDPGHRRTLPETPFSVHFRFELQRHASLPPQRIHFLLQEDPEPKIHHQTPQHAAEHHEKVQPNTLFAQLEPHQ